MSFTAETRQRSKPVLPLAAMVDVLFLLLIFFMTVSVFREQELQIPVTLTPTETGAVAEGVAPLVVTVTAENEIYMSQQELTLAEIGPRFEAIADELPGSFMVVIRGDETADHGMIMRLMDLARQAGFEDVRMAVAGQTSEQ